MKTLAALALGATIAFVEPAWNLTLKAFNHTVLYALVYGHSYVRALGL